MKVWILDQSGSIFCRSLACSPGPHCALAPICLSSPPFHLWRPIIRPTFPSFNPRPFWLCSTPPARREDMACRQVWRFSVNGTEAKFLHAIEHMAVMHIILGMNAIIPTTIYVIACHLECQSAKGAMRCRDCTQDSIAMHSCKQERSNNESLR